ncbi:MAG TPA: tRNA (N(6)-L-threonylcarbamoyladenosine(37)-C(2))-methylthiotransferase [Thermoplasmata archaeon]|nr:tRNA (N(6)-L-threonylcarbamoyladenosine(37)-C(2))-methylthiotransferase [Thermoplasmata archaeon]
MRVYVESYGCAQNRGEGAAIARDLAAHGHEIAESPVGAEVGVLVSCGVIGATEARMVRRWRLLSSRLPRVVVTGCLVPLRTDLMDGPGRERTTFLPIREQSRLPGLLDQGRGDGVGEEDPARVPFPLRSHPPVSEEVIIAQGCTSGCSYCFSRLARGPLTSVPSETVVARVRSAVARGVCEIRLTGLDTAVWGSDRTGSEGLPGLLRAVDRVDGDFQVRVGMMSPQSLEPLLDDYLEALDDPHNFRFLHLPVQSGSDTLLERMHREYTADTFRRLVARARGRFPDLYLSTDVIVGYPGETEEDHRATEGLLSEVAPETVNVTRFSPRPGTPAARLPPLGPRVAKRRSRSLTELRRRLARSRLESWIGRRARARVTEHGPAGSAVARLDNYLPVVLDRRPPLGATVELTIRGARTTYLLGQLGDAF